MNSAYGSLSGGTNRMADDLVDKLQEPRIVEALVTLLDKSDKLAMFTEALEGFLVRSDGLFESISRSVVQVRKAGAGAFGKSLEKIDLDDIKSASGQLQGMLPLMRDLVSELGALKQAGVFDADVVAILGRTGRAMAATVRDPKARSNETRGIFSLLGLLKDPDVARSLNFLISFARHFGGNLNDGGNGSAVNTLPTAATQSSARKKLS
jgi:Protein of unknown function (DUF1641)